mmetsp:Transcript_2206/g.8627  ORF Transcript_2206/g.8627 Transcript_2206/m.8627 type:complete len:176 (+) Transcript_2206:2968-3495(+)
MYFPRARMAVESFKLVENDLFREKELRSMLEEAGSRQVKDVISDIRAQVAANNKGIALMEDLMSSEGAARVQKYMKEIQNTAAVSVQDMLRRISIERGLKPKDSVYAEDFMDNGLRIKLKLTIDRDLGTAEFDFAGTSAEVGDQLLSFLASSTDEGCTIPPALTSRFGICRFTGT